MTKESILRLTGFRLVGEEKQQRAFGMIAGYPVLAMASRRGLQLVFSATNAPDRKEFRAIRDAFKNDETLGKHVIATKDEAGILTIAISGKDEAEMRRLYEQTKLRLTETVQGMENFAPPTACHICHQEGGDTLAQMDGTLTIVYRSCLQSLKQEQAERIENSKANGSGVIQGILGGLIGGVVGAAPAFIALHFMEYFVFLLFALIPLGAYFGWKLLGGKLTRITTVFVIIYSLFLSFAVEVIDTHLILAELYAEFGMAGQIRFMDTVRYYFTPEVFMEYFARNVLMAMGAAIVGIFIAWGLITKTDKGALAQTESTLNEAVPIERV